MEDEELEKTKPIKVLSELNANEERSTLRTNREEKYKDALLEEDKKDNEEAAEEALAEKNIALAESLLEKEENDTSVVNEPVKEEEPKEEVNPKKIIKKEPSLKDKILNKWKELSKTEKAIVCIIGSILFCILVVGLVFIFKTEEPGPAPKPAPPVVEEAPVVADNYKYKSGKLYFLNEKDEEIGEYECDNKDSNLCYVAYNTNDNFDTPVLLDENKMVKKERIPIIENQFAFIIDSKDEKTGTISLYDMTAKEIKDTYKEVKVYKDNYIVIKNKDNKYGLLKYEKNTIKEVIKPTYYYLGMINGESNLVAKGKKGYVIIDKNNKTLSSSLPSREEIKFYNKYMIVTEFEDVYSVYDYKARLLKGGYDFATLNDKYMALVKDDLLTVVDNENVKYNEGNIKLLSDEYVKKYIYDSEDVLSKTLKSFDIRENKENVEVVLYEEDNDPTYKQLNINEALANKPNSYVNYFDGKLYFYSDDKKEDLIGSYTCTFRNEIESSKDVYDTCFIAKDAIYENNDMEDNSSIGRKSYSPIINDQYVFIKDNDTVKLFNLKTDKNLSTYESINTYTPNNDFKVTRKVGKLNVVAKNKKGKYGVITIDGETVSPLYSFDYNYIEKLGSVYSAKLEDGTYQVLGNSTIFPNKLMGYNKDMKYFKMVKDGKYSVISNDGESVNTDSLIYVSLSDDYFVGVLEDRMINIYDYNGKVLVETKLTAPDYPFVKTPNPAFKVKRTGEKKFKVSIFSGKEYIDTEFDTSKKEEEVTPKPTPDEPGKEDTNKES